MDKIERMLSAASVAVVGASSDPTKTGHIILKNLLAGGFAGEVYPVNPRSEEVLGLRCYPSLKEVPAADIDLVVVVVPARFVQGVIEEAALKRAAGAVVISGGFAEIGKAELQQELVETARKTGIRILGPNCQGMTYTPNNICVTWPLMKERGKMAVVSQSGTVGAAFAGWAEEEALGLAAFLSLGNKADIDEIDLLQQLSADEEISVLGFYLEGIRDGRLFMKEGRAAARKKPVVVLRPGRTEKGKQAVQSHTRSISGDHLIFDAAVKQTGMIRAETVYELYDFAKIFSLIDPPGGNRCLIVTSSGGSAIIATDVAEEAGVEIGKLNSGARQRLAEVLPGHCVVANPLDLTGDTDADRYYQAVSAVRDEDFDLVLLIFGDPIPGAAAAAARLQQEISQQVIACYLGGGTVQEMEVLALHRAGIPTFPTPERAMKAVAALVRYGNYQKRNNFAEQRE